MPKKIKLMLCFLFFGILTLCLFSRLMLIVSYVHLISDPVKIENIQRIPCVEKIDMKRKFPILSLGYATLGNPLSDQPDYLLEKLPKIILDYKSTKIAFMPPSEYGIQLSQWHRKRYQENPNFYSSDQDDRENLFDSYIDLYNARKKMYYTVNRPLSEIIFMSIDELKSNIYNLKLKSVKTCDVYHFETPVVNAFYEINPEPSPKLTIIYIYWKEKKYYMPVIIESELGKEKLVEIAKVIISTYNLTIDKIPENKEKINDIILKKLRVN